MKNTTVIIFALLLVVGAGVLFYVKSTGNSAPAEKLEKKDNLNNNKTMSIVTLHTNKGDIEIELFVDRTPNTVANFTKLAGEGFYNGVKFHRVIPGFMIQGGDPLTKDDSKVALWGTGGPGYSFADEITPENKNDIGTISMANAGPNTNGSQFFINTAANNFLDGKHTVFGRVVSGMETVSAIENIPTGEADRPLNPVVINTVTIK
ncbi:hypothetical protein A3D42_01635 [Candidatus Nomurabacteria bacterium RIFCSPHIGHO2_02_FULL_41_18]|uniref:Peptidyl-prolyl cis-trans isomerase n=1 Tax=Candidatus Nomurabacteria bacterium RIFCSPHIGHO2_02_FULL_41_18 TaxID=1801754 RepID=A0A1F6W5N6_9BACT|nr:MAG: hypothetical protein A2737_01450 [Candidatus Nomurabacteria bacterium RIFCSPHIGHO2_01_FULL_41_71]OGI77219.1 MAG: hypothetical protein A3D42_01635 [Candidatus Nomurabacteria bacterium RIFCSPHIGHO2_02_FULL_41_18]OGI89394.1 MAG: hypothetical protein A3B01_01370 [Candidatus Nomurabacteria bacterium RIFCSPLOWO2_01_FULL_41_52b]